MGTGVFSGPLGKRVALEEGETGKTRMVPGALVLTKSPDHAEGESFKDQDNR